MSLEEKLLSNIDTLLTDYRVVKDKSKRIPNKEQNSFGKGWDTVILKYGRPSKISYLIPNTFELLLDERIRAAHFITLYPKSFVPANTKIKYYDDAVVHHIPLIIPEGETGMIFSDNYELKKWKMGETLTYDGSRTYAGYNFTDEERVILHIVQ
jgi:hypothetical protein